ncbi:MAG: TonB-dependent receptor [Proteobacteria bacterium]|nr:TonB-dependent receptor [Pseudomonadota bacterium]HQR03174.1 TonB-dependent receptor [Rhodocyclaceae bacterium]
MQRSKCEMRKLNPLAAAVASVIALGALPGHAADTGLEEVIVTAQKQAQSLQEVPISMQAFDAKTLENANISSMSDLRSLTASVSFKPYPATTEALVITMRGVPIGNISIYNDPAVAISIDGVYIARSTGLNLTVADLESVEVLKGPQGTLYGRNAVAGALNLNTIRPSQEFGFMQNITVGNYGKLTSKTSVNVPITDTLAGKIAYIHDEHDGYIKDSNGSGTNWGDRKADAGRVDLRWRPSGQVTVDYGYDWSKSEFIDTNAQCLNQTNSLTGLPIANRALYGAPYVCSTSVLTSLPMRSGSGLGTSPGKSHTENSGHMLRVEWNVSSTLTVRSITGYRELKDSSVNKSVVGMIDAVSVNIPGFVISGVTHLPTGQTSLNFPYSVWNTNDKYLSQEVDFIGRPSEYFRYTAGLYYFDEKGNYQKPPGLGNTIGPILLPTMGEMGTAHNSSWALFGQFTWTPDILDRKLDIVPGIRYTRDRRDATLNVGSTATYIPGPMAAMPPGTYLYLPPNPASVINASGSNSFSRTSPALTVQYHINDDVMVYGKVVKGYRSGGFNDLASTQSRFSAGFAPETLTSTELGIKGEYFDRRLRANFAWFESKYSDQIVVVPTTISGKYDAYNAGKSTFDGFELDLTAAVTDALRLGFNWAHVNFKYNKVTDPVTGVDMTDFIHLLPSKDNYTLTMDYAFGKVGPGKLNWHLDYSHIDKSYTSTLDSYNSATGVLIARRDPANNTTPAQDTWNTRVSMNGIPVGPGNHGDLSVGLWVKNLTDRRFPIFASDFSNYGMPVGSASRFNDPRTVGIDLTYRY